MARMGAWSKPGHDEGASVLAHFAGTSGKRCFLSTRVAKLKGRKWEVSIVHICHNMDRASLRILWYQKNGNGKRECSDYLLYPRISYTYSYTWIAWLLSHSYLIWLKLVWIMMCHLPRRLESLDWTTVLWLIVSDLIIRYSFTKVKPMYFYGRDYCMYFYGGDYWVNYLDNSKKSLITYLFSTELFVFLKF